MLIVLAATICLAGVWLVALRPKSDSGSTAAKPALPTTAIPKAKQASAASDAANAKLQAATGASGTSGAGTSAAPSPAAGATPSTTSGAPITAATGASSQERRVLREMSHGKVVVILFWNPDGADDVATRGALRSLDRHRGKVAVHVERITRVGSYGSITRGVTVEQAPTTVIIGRHRRARAIVGLTEPHELSQAVGDALAGR